MRALLALLLTSCALNSRLDAPDYQPEPKPSEAGSTSCGGASGASSAGSGGQSVAGESSVAGNSGGQHIGGSAGEAGAITSGASGNGGSAGSGSGIPKPRIWDVCPHFPDAWGRVDAAACPKEYPRISYSCFSTGTEQRVCTFDCAQTNGPEECERLGGQCKQVASGEPLTCQP